jgi:outer membrane receptor protein involved in Fe transport
MNDQLVATIDGYGNSCNCVSTLNNGVPTVVQILLGPNVSRNNLTTTAGFVDDTWRFTGRVTLSLGMRLDRYQPILPEQQGPAGQTFPAIDPVLTFNNWAHAWG